MACEGFKTDACCGVRGKKDRRDHNDGDPAANNHSPVKIPKADPSEPQQHTQGEEQGTCPGVTLRDQGGRRRDPCCPNDHRLPESPHPQPFRKGAK